MNATQFELEQWRPVLGFEDSYQVSSHGRVRSVDRTVIQSDGTVRSFQGQLLVQSKLNEYRIVGLSRANRTHSRTVHRLVLEAFVGPRPEGMEACHGDSDGANNRLDNLRWDTRLANARDRVNAGNAARVNSHKTHCAQGHEYTPENTYRPPSRPNERVCRACRRKRGREAYRASRRASDDSGVTL